MMYEDYWNSIILLALKRNWQVSNPLAPWRQWHSIHYPLPSGTGKPGPNTVERLEQWMVSNGLHDFWFGGAMSQTNSKSSLGHCCWSLPRKTTKTTHVPSLTWFSFAQKSMSITILANFHSKCCGFWCKVLNSGMGCNHLNQRLDTPGNVKTNHMHTGLVTQQQTSYSSMVITTLDQQK